MSNTLISIISLIVSVIILYSEVETGYQLLFILPLLYALLIKLSKSIFVYARSNIGFISIIVVTFIRYVVTPLVLIISGYYSGFGSSPTEETMLYAFLLMIYEMIAVFITINLVGRNLKGNIVKEISRNNYLRSSFVLFLFSVFALLYLLKFPNILVPNNLLIIKDEIKQFTLDFQFSGALILINACLRIAILIMILDFFKRRYDRLPIFSYPLLSSIALISYLALMTGIARWDILISAFVGTYILVWLYPEYSKIIRLSIFSVVGIAIISITVYKFFHITSFDEIQLRLFLEEIFKQFQAYFSGPRNVGQAIEMNNSLGGNISFITLINDFIGSIPGVSSFINQADRINMYYNYHIYGTLFFASQIIPMIGVGYSYFGFIGAPFFTVICIYLSLKFGLMTLNEDRIEFKYIYSYASIWLALCMGFNTQIIFGWFATIFIPMYILFSLNRKFVLLKK